MITNKFDCTIHGVVASCCLECSQNRAAELDSARKRIENLEVENAELAKCSKQDGMVEKQQKIIEMQKGEFKKLRNEIERLKLALVEENSVKKVNPIDAFATMGSVKMMQEEIKRLEGELEARKHETELANAYRDEAEELAVKVMDLRVERRMQK